MKALLFLNGQKPSKKIMDSIDFQNNYVVCADGAFNYLKDKAKFIDLIVGDFDSIKHGKKSEDKFLKDNIYSHIEISAFNSEKDYTDSYLAIKILIEKGYDEIEIYGATGKKRIDHQEYNYLLLGFCSENNIKAKIIDSMFDIYFVSNSIFNIDIQKNKIVSLVPYGDSSHILYSKGLKYPLIELTLNKHNCSNSKDLVMGVSNISIENNIEFRVSAGAVLTFLER